MKRVTPDGTDLNARSPGQVLRLQALELQGLKQGQLALALGVSRAIVNQVVNDRRGISAEMALRLDQVLGIPAEVWLTLQAQVDLQNARQKCGTQIAQLPRLREAIGRIVDDHREGIGAID